MEEKMEMGNIFLDNMGYFLKNKTKLKFQDLILQLYFGASYCYMT